MAVVYIEARPKGREHEPITHYVVEEKGDKLLHQTKTQAEAIDWAKKNGHSPHIARVRHLSDKAEPGHWRAA